ncbi:MAG: type II secretion system F family protein [Pseudomonadota bacterium]
MSSDMMLLAMCGLGFLAIAAVFLVLTSGGEDKGRKRAKQLSETGAAVSTKRGKSRRDTSEAAQRRKQTQQMLEKLRAEGKQTKSSLVPNDIAAKLAQAGIRTSPQTYWILAVISGLVFAAVAFMSGADGFSISGIDLKNRIVVVVGAGAAGFLGLPSWVLGHLANSRAKKMTNQFADALDIIVRGVKSGLPLTECLRIIAKESPAPLGTEFGLLTDNLSMGSTMERALQGMYERVPLPEVNFFVIVLTIQAKAGGNLSEALGNLSAVIRSRRMMREKISALSSEAKASAMIIGALPFVVGFLIYLSQPSYIIPLFTEELGHFLIGVGLVMMTMGTLMMRKMINFEM